MFIILGADGKEYGPASSAKIQEWIRAGRANLQTKARRSNDTEWRALGEYPEFAAPPVATTEAAPPPAAGPAPESGPGPVPTFTPATPAAAAPTGPVDPKAYAEDLLARAAPLDVFGCLAESFELWKANFLPLVGVTFVVTVITTVLGMIPLLGAVGNILLNGVFYGGLYFYYLGKLRGEPREFADVFAGFTKAFGPLVLASLIIVALSVAVGLVLLGPWFAAILMTGFAHSSLTFKALIFCGLFLCSLPLVYLSVSWAFTFILVIDQGLSPWTAMEVSRRVISRYWFRVFFVALLGGILAMLGLIGLIIGVFFTLPLALGAVVCAYENLCSPPAPKA